jgi:hypothetical protein
LRPFEGTYSGASGSTRCRITDISIGGCFVQSLSGPSPGAPTVVTILIGSHALAFPGKVVYVDSGMGFAVQFSDIPQVELDELSRLLSAFEASKASA